MPKTDKKELRKMKDKVVHVANDLRKFMNTKKIPDEQQELLDQAHTDLINATNRIVEATQV